nr:hypothetical protein [Acidithiobacillus ferriphilus]
MADPIHAYADKVGAAAKSIGHGLVNVVPVGRERERELRLARHMLAQLDKAGVKRRLAPSKAHS